MYPVYAWEVLAANNTRRKGGGGEKDAVIVSRKNTRENTQTRENFFASEGEPADCLLN